MQNGASRLSADWDWKRPFVPGAVRKGKKKVPDTFSALPTTFAYNTLGQRYKITWPSISYRLSDGTETSDSPVTSVTFDALGNVASMTDGNASLLSAPYTTTYTHDGLSRLTGVTRPAPSGSGSGLTTSYGYNQDSELTSVTDPLGNVTSIAYWRNGLKKSIQLPNPADGSTTGGTQVPVYQYGYTAAGQLQTVTDPFSKVTTYAYSATGQLSSVTLPSITVGGSTVTPVIGFYHDASGNQTAEKDPDGNTTYYNFDHLNRLAGKREYVATGLASPSYTTETDAQALTSYLYDAAGNLTRATTAIDATTDRVVGYAYNGLGQLTSENWFANSTSTTASHNTISYTHKDAGELLTATDTYGSSDSRNSKYTFTTNALGWVTQVDNNGGSTSGTAGVPRVVLDAKYDPNGNRTALNAQVDRGTGDGLKDDFQNAYAFDRLNRMTSVIQDASANSGHFAVGYKKSTFAWDNANRLTTKTHYKTSSTQVASGTFSYDHDSRLTSLNWSGYGGPYTGGYFDKLAWSYDLDSRVQSFTSGINSNENLTYDYDNDSQLKSAVASYGGYGGGYGGGTYGWDGNGDSTLSGWVTGKGNRLLKDGTYRYEYDVAGHMTKRTALTGGAFTEYGWDARGRMISVTDRNSSSVIQQKIDYGYDVFNDLIQRTVTPYSGGNPVTGSITTARFVYDITGTGTAVLAFNGNQSLTDRYLWGPAVDEILADERYSPSGSNVMPSAAGSIYWALTDNQNSVRDWIAYGSLVDHVIYDSFGKIYSQSSTSVPFAFMHNGVFYDPSSGLEYHSQPGTGIPGRWYNPAIRRWMSADPTGLAAGPDQYEYCNNSPTNSVDPSGLEDYRTKFIAECKNMPKEWQVHHIIEQGREIIAERFKAELGEDIIDSLDNLRGVDRKTHGEISAIQVKFWNAQATKYGSHTEAYKKIPLEEVRALQTAIKEDFGSLWVEAKATAEEIATVQKAAENARKTSLRPARITGTLKKVGIVLTGFAIFTMISDNVSLGCNILDPPAHVQAALDRMLRTYVEVYDQADSRGFLKKEDWTKLQDATLGYMKAAEYDEKIRAIMFKQFTEGGLSLP